MNIVLFFIKDRFDFMDGFFVKKFDSIDFIMDKWMYVFYNEVI